MEIRNLQQTTLSEIVQCLTASFADYFVPLSSDIGYWEKRFRAARVDFSLSYGMFDKDVLVGFIINGIDDLGGKKTAYNTGTGVTAAARGKKIIDRLYEYALPRFKEQNIVQCTLEVIQQNERALHVYERIGFGIKRRLRCYKGDLVPSDTTVSSSPVSFESIDGIAQQFDHLYSWDFTTAAIKAAGDQFHCYEVLDIGGQRLGYFVINPANGQVIQFEALTGTEDRLPALLSAIASVSPSVRIINVDGERTERIAVLNDAGLDNFIDQYEMHMSI